MAGTNDESLAVEQMLVSLSRRRNRSDEQRRVLELDLNLFGGRVAMAYKYAFWAVSLWSIHLAFQQSYFACPTDCASAAEIRLETGLLSKLQDGQLVLGSPFCGGVRFREVH